jgi:large subunit ribosomal protein L15
MKFKRSKSSKQRGSSSHGWGAKKKHRGAGHRGGRGNAGSGKRGDSKKPSFWKLKRRFGKHGFTSKVRNKYKTINVSELDAKLDSFVKNNKAEFKSGTYKIDLSNLKISKLLGAGKTTKKIEVNVDMASDSAVKKIESLKGKVILKDNVTETKPDASKKAKE